MTTVTSRFDQHALDALPSRAPFVERLRARSFDAFEALPIPSQETEEWRYTDLEGLDLDLQPFAEGGGPEAVNRHGSWRRPACSASVRGCRSSGTPR